MDACIALRTMVMADGVAYLQAGAGVVADSDPEAEHEECLKKLAALEAAIDLAESEALVEMKVLMLDNYDSFTYNLVHLFEELGAEVVTMRNDAITVEEARGGGYDRLVVSPGPGRPESAGISVELIRVARATMPTLGVCLGTRPSSRRSAERSGRRRHSLHGKSSTIAHDGLGVYPGLPSEVEVGRYHSLAALTVPAELPSPRRRRDGEVMGVRHRELPDRGSAVPPGERVDPARAARWRGTSSE